MHSSTLFTPLIKITSPQVPIFSELTEEPDRLLPIKSRRKTSKLVNMISVIIATICLIMTGWV